VALDPINLFSGLIQFIDAAPPSATRQKFIDLAVSKGLGTEAEATLFIDTFVQQTFNKGWIDTNTFDAFFTRAKALELKKVVNFGHDILKAVQASKEFQDETNQIFIDQINAEIVVLDRLNKNALIGRNY
jgi:hypothetical protein